MDVAFFGIAFAGVFLATFRSLGWGFLAVITIGYFNGVIRANYLGVFTTFMFDSGVLGLYLGFLIRKSHREKGVVLGPAARFVVFLIAWPVFLCFIPVNHFLIQCVALRATVWFLPVLLLATRLTTGDLALLARGLAMLNLVALAAGVYVYLYGVEALYPHNAITELIYRSHDVGEAGYHRIPASFLSAHAYGFTMLATLPFLLDRCVGVRVRLVDRWLAAAGVVAAAGGLLMCGARSPFVALALSSAIALLLTRFSFKIAFVLAVLVGVGFAVARDNERFQRARTLGDVERVTGRVSNSVNLGVLDLVFGYPFGAGMGTAVGNSVPFFLRDLAPEQIGAENEYCRIMIDQGWFGVAGWLLFVGWLCARPPSARPPGPWRLGVVFMYSLIVAQWTTAFIGNGLLAAIPGAFLMLTEMGVLVVVRNVGAVPEGVARRTLGLSDFLVETDPEEVPCTSSGVVPGRDWPVVESRMIGHGRQFANDP
jgi:hypothetical protein